MMLVSVPAAETVASNTTVAVFGMIGVLGAALIAGAASVLGIWINARAQHQPVKVKHAEAVDAEGKTVLEQLAEMREDRDRWRDLALEWMPERRGNLPD